MEATPIPVAIFQRRLVRKGNAAAPQVLIKWAYFTDHIATWVDYYVFKTRYPDATPWEEDQGQVIPQGCVCKCHTFSRVDRP
jgi:hypothetical protein